MLPAQALSIIQAGLKFALDIDPALTEHLLRNALHHTVLLANSMGDIIRTAMIKCADLVIPAMDDVREFRLSNLHL